MNDNWKNAEHRAVGPKYEKQPSSKTCCSTLTALCTVIPKSAINKPLCKPLARESGDRVYPLVAGAPALRFKMSACCFLTLESVNYAGTENKKRATIRHGQLFW